MTVQITIRDVPVEIKEELAARAAGKGWSMQEYLKNELQRIASRPAIESVLARIEERKAMSPRAISDDLILELRDEDRT